MDEIMGTWKVKRGSEANMDAFMQASLVPEGIRHVFLERDYEVTFSREPSGNKLKCAVFVTNDPRLERKEYQFELGKEFQIHDVDGQHFKCVFNWDGERFVEQYIDDTGTKMDVHREILPNGEMLFTMTFRGVTASSRWVKYQH